MIQPLRSISITETSTLIRVGPPLCPASVLSLSWVLHLSFSLIIGTTGSHVPHKSLIQVRATFMPDAAQAVNRFPPDLSWSSASPQFRRHLFVFDTSSVVRLRSSPSPSLDTITSCLFLQDSPPRLSTAAAWGSLKPASAGRLLLCHFVTQAE